MPHRPITPHAPARPVIYAALTLLAGTAAGFRLSINPLLPLLLALLLLLLSARRLWHSRSVHGPLAGGGALLLLALALLAWSRAAWITARDRAALATVAALAREDLVLIEGRLRAEPRLSPDHLELVIAAPAIAPRRSNAPASSISLDVSVSIAGEAAAALLTRPDALPLPGRPIRAWGRLRALTPSTTPNPFDPERAGLARGIVARLTVARPAELELGPPPSGPRAAAAAALRRARRAVVDVLALRLPAAQLPTARALLIGEAHLIPVPRREAYALTGLAHLLAVSGLNTAFVLLLIIIATRLLGLSPRVSAWCGIAGVLAYAALTGFEPPVMRAAVMGIFFLGGYLLRRVTSPPATLAAAALATLLADPRNLVRVDWQLSYACVLSIIVLTPPLYDAFTRPFRRATPPGAPPDPPGWLSRQFHQHILLPLAVVIAVHVGILPLQIEIFRQYNLLSTLYNLFCCALSLLAMCGVILTALLGAIPFLGVAAALPAHAGLTGLSWFVTHTAAIPHVTLSLLPLSAPLLMAYYLILLGGSWLRGGAGPGGRLDPAQLFRFGFSLLALLCLVIWAQVLAATPARRALDLYVLDVGQGDALVARFPNGRVMVVDAGPASRTDHGRLTLAPFLKTLGCSTIDCLVATHADADHIGGLPYLLGRFDVALMLEGPDTSDLELYRRLHETARARGIPIQPARQGTLLTGFEPAEVRLLGPVPGAADNNASLVLRVDYDETEMLLTGDLEAAGERSLIASGHIADVEILKLGHHGSGSSTSRELLDAARPEAALISAGKFNRYGHPDPVVLERLAQAGAVAFRTDQLGTLWLRTDGRRIRVYRFAGR